MYSGGETKRQRGANVERGFTLPVVLITSIIMMIVLVLAMQIAASSAYSLREQYYNQLTREAAESGLAMAQGCLERNYYIAQWGGQPLVPHAPCTGAPACNNADTCFMKTAGNIRMRFSVDKPIDNGDGTQLATATGIVELVRSSDGVIFKSYTQTLRVTMASSLSFSRLGMGYLDDAGSYAGAYYGIVSGDGQVRTAGANKYGQLGYAGAPVPLGTQSMTPSIFKLPPGVRALSLYINPFSQAYNTFVLGTDRQVYGVGRNSGGQLGNGNTTNTDTAQKFILPAGKTARFVYSSGFATYVITNDNLLYVAGRCTNGILGLGYSIPGCSDVSVPQQVVLPGGDTVSSTVDPANVISSDDRTVLVIGASGKVYSWGYNLHGAVGDGTIEDRSTIYTRGSWGQPGKPKAVQVLQASAVSAVLGSDGSIEASGENSFGELGHRYMRFVAFDNGRQCLTAYSSAVALSSCTNSPNHTNDMQTFYAEKDGTLRSTVTGTCLRTSSPFSNNLFFDVCPPSGSSVPPVFQWQISPWGLTTGTGRHITRTGGNSVGLTTGGSSGFTTAFPLPTKVDYPSHGITGKVIKMVGDEYTLSILTDQGEIWSYGFNTSGKFGDGSNRALNAEPVKFTLPPGVRAVELWDTGSNVNGRTVRQLFAVGNNGKIYGAGTNDYGQLGDGTTTARFTPVEMLNVTNALRVASAGGTTVAITSDRVVWAVGNNDYGQLGDGTTVSKLIPAKTRYLNLFSAQRY